MTTTAAEPDPGPRPASSPGPGPSRRSQDDAAGPAGLHEGLGDALRRPPDRRPATPSFRLQPEPIFRLNNPVSGRQGRRHLPLGRRGRPARGGGPGLPDPQRRLAPRVHLALDRPVRRRGRLGRVLATRRGPGLEFKPVPDAPRPAATPERGSARSGPWPRTSPPTTISRARRWNTLRLLPKPLARYGKAGADRRGRRPLRVRPGDRPRGLPDARGPARQGRPRMAIRLRPDDLLGSRARGRARTVWRSPGASTPRTRPRRSTTWIYSRKVTSRRGSGSHA